MRDLCGENNLPAGVIDQGQTSGPAARIELDAQWLKLRNVTRFPASAFLMVRALRLRVLRANPSGESPRLSRIALSPVSAIIISTFCFVFRCEAEL